MRFYFSNRSNWLIITLVVGGVFSYGLMASAKPLATTPLDDLFLLDAPPSLQAMMHPSTIQPSVPILKKGYPNKNEVAHSYLATVTTSSNLPPISKQWQETPDNSPSVQASSSLLSTQDLLLISRTPELLLALQRMNYVPTARTSLTALRQRGGRVLFKNLSELGSQYATFDALAWLSKEPSMEGAWVLFIADKHRKAPVEALASLITHEALHSDFQNSYCEEEHAWLAEVTAWKEFKALNPTLQHIPKGWFGLVDRLNAIETALAQQTLKPMIRNNPGYAGLQEASPYFRYSPFATPLEVYQQSVSNNTSFSGQLLPQQGAVIQLKQQPKASSFAIEPQKLLPVASNGRPKLMLRPLRTW